MRDTKKKWRVRLNPLSALIPGHIVEVDDDVQTPICIVHESEQNHRKGTPTRADIAYLISASPELLAALKTALPVLDDAEQDAREKALAAREAATHSKNRQNLDLLARSAERWDHVADCYRGDAEAARAAIAKAQGKPSVKQRPTTANNRKPRQTS